MSLLRGLGLALAVAGCAPQPPAPPDPGPPPYAPPPYGADGPDDCGAPELQWLVGRDRSQIPPPQPGRPRRVVARGDPVTMDFSPVRQNIEYDRQTGRVLRVYCG